jgi:hypothetical protein
MIKKLIYSPFQFCTKFATGSRACRTGIPPPRTRRTCKIALPLVCACLPWTAARRQLCNHQTLCISVRPPWVSMATAPLRTRWPRAPKPCWSGRSRSRYALLPRNRSSPLSLSMSEILVSVVLRRSQFAFRGSGSSAIRMRTRSSGIR